MLDDFLRSVPQERATRFELATCSLGSYHSTTELHPQVVGTLARRVRLSSGDSRLSKPVSVSCTIARNWNTAARFGNESH